VISPDDFFQNILQRDQALQRAIFNQQQRAKCVLT